MARTLQVGERITIAKLIEKLQTVEFNELTEEKYNELFVGHTLQGLNEVREDCKDLLIDDYVFTIHKISLYDEDECNGSGFRINNSIFLSNYVEVWLPSDNNGSNDIQASGKIKRSDNLFYLDVEYSVD